MSVQVTCESCGKRVSFPADKAGAIDLCPECFEYIDVPMLETSAQPVRRAASRTQAAGFALTFEDVDNLPRPQWELFCQRVYAELPERLWHDAFLDAARVWLDALAGELTGAYSSAESANFLLLSALPSAEQERLLEFCEETRATILSHLNGIAADGGYGKHVVLAFADAEAYYTYISHFHAEGEYGGSGGMFLSDTYRHIALHATRHWLHRTLAHELTHVCLAHLPLPLWLNEGITQEMEDVLLSQSMFQPGVELVHRQRRYWRERSLESFWSGEAFQAADEGQELAYALARILVRNLGVDFGERFSAFVQAADSNDAGRAGAANVLGLTLGEVAGQYLGEGAWEPQGTYATPPHEGRGQP